MHQAVACAEAKVTLISPFVGRILDWYKKSTGKESYAPAEDPGVKTVTEIYNYYKKYGHKTEVMGASFRNIGEIIELAGCDLLTIAPNLLAELEKTTGELPRKLDAAKAKAMDIPKITMDEATFRKMHEADRMANDKLDEGIKGFTKAIEGLEKQLAERLAVPLITRGTATPGGPAGIRGGRRSFEREPGSLIRWDDAPSLSVVLRLLDPRGARVLRRVQQQRRRTPGASGDARRRRPRAFEAQRARRRRPRTAADELRPRARSQMKDGTESDVDCGGTDGCARCALGKKCQVDEDCQTGASCTQQAAAPSATTRRRTATRADVDCGGKACGACTVGKRCKVRHRLPERYVHDQLVRLPEGHDDHLARHAAARTASISPRSARVSTTSSSPPTCR